MKRQRFLYLVGLLFFGGLVVGRLFWIFSGGGEGLAGQTAVSPPTHTISQTIIDEGWITAVSANIRRAEYHITPLEGEADAALVFHSPNRAQELRTTFSGNGIQVTPRQTDADGWTFGLRVIGVGNGIQTIAPEAGAFSAAETRLTVDYGRWRTWYVNDSRGLEQGFTLDAPLFAQETGKVVVNLALTGDLAPVLAADGKGVELVTAVGEPVLTYQGLFAFDAHGAELPAVMEVAALPGGQPAINLVVDSANAEYPLVIDPILGSAIIWETWLADQADSNFGFSVSTAGDVNGDGFDDVLVGAPWFDGGEPAEGAVFAYYGTPSGLPPTYQWLVEGNVPHMELGFAVNPAGDVNADNFDDIIVGTHFSPTGRALVFAGSPGGLLPAPLWVKDGEQPGDGFGMAVNTAGDVNGDNVDDIIIGAPYFDGGSEDDGRAYVFYGPISSASLTPDWVAEGGVPDIYAGGLFGYAVSTAGDVNQDGFADVIIGEPLADNDGPVGLAALFGGSPNGLVQPGTGPASRDDADWVSFGDFAYGSWFGAAVGLAGDVNGDGFDDVIVGAPQYSYREIYGEGAAFVFTGTTPISNVNPLPDNSWTFYGGVSDAMLGHAVGSAGDIDQDGYDEVIVGAPQYDNDVFPNKQPQAIHGGGAFILHGAPSGWDWIWEFSSNIPEAKLGTSVGTAGDVNGDGYADVIFGTPQMANPGGTLGEAFALFGSGQIEGLTAFNDSPTTLGQPTQFGATFDAGGALEFAWDLGDGAQAVGAFVQHVYAHPGQYTAVLTATSFTDEMTATTAVTVSQSSLINPVSGGHLEFVNEETGFGTKVDVPPGAVTETLQLSYTPLTTITQPSPENSVGYYFDLNTGPPNFAHQLYLPLVVKGEGGGTAVSHPNDIASPASSYTFAKPVTVTIVYTDAGLTPQEELSLKLLYWNKEQQDWLDIALECDLEDTYAYFPEQNYFTVQVCHLSRFSVAG